MMKNPFTSATSFSTFLLASAVTATALGIASVLSYRMGFFPYYVQLIHLSRPVWQLTALSYAFACYSTNVFL